MGERKFQAEARVRILRQELSVGRTPGGQGGVAGEEGRGQIMLHPFGQVQDLMSLS